jgi:hypothetical protein
MHFAVQSASFHPQTKFKAAFELFRLSLQLTIGIVLAGASRAET